MGQSIQEIGQRNSNFFMEEIEIKFYKKVFKYHNGFSHSVYSWSNSFDNSIVKPDQDFWGGDKN